MDGGCKVNGHQVYLGCDDISRKKIKLVKKNSYSILKYRIKLEHFFLLLFTSFLLLIISCDSNPTSSNKEDGNQDPFEGTIEIVTELTPNIPTYHVNPNDPTFASIPAGKDSIIQFFGIRDSNGWPSNLVGFRKLLKDNSDKAETVYFDTLSRPSLITSGNGDQLAFEYIGDTIKMVIQLADGSQEEIIFNNENWSKGKSLAKRKINSSNQNIYNKKTQDLIYDLVDKYNRPLVHGRVSGRYRVGFNPLSHIIYFEESGEGRYAAILPTEPHPNYSAVKLNFPKSCDIFNNEVRETCNFLDTVNFFESASIVCNSLPEGTPQRFTCLALVNSLNFGCSTEKNCKGFGELLDLFLTEFETTNFTINASGPGYNNCSETLTETFNPPISLPLYFKNQLECFPPVLKANGHIQINPNPFILNEDKELVIRFSAYANLPINEVLVHILWPNNVPHPNKCIPENFFDVFPGTTSVIFGTCTVEIESHHPAGMWDAYLEIGTPYDYPYRFAGNANVAETRFEVNQNKLSGSLAVDINVTPLPDLCCDYWSGNGRLISSDLIFTRHYDNHPYTGYSYEGLGTYEYSGNYPYHPVVSNQEPFTRTENGSGPIRVIIYFDTETQTEKIKFSFGFYWKNYEGFDGGAGHHIDTHFNGTISPISGGTITATQIVDYFGYAETKLSIVLTLTPTSLNQ